jgi:hypothetical protein
MTKTKLNLLRSLLDELEEERQQFARDEGLEVDDEAFARLASQYLGKPLPLLGASRAEPERDKRRTRHARDSQDIAAEFEANCRELRLRLQRGE